MKTCPACSEDIKDDAKKCRHCHYLIEPHDQLFAKHPPAKQFNLTLDTNLIRFSGAAVTVLTVFVVVFIAIYGFDLRNASLELERYQKTNERMKETIKEAEKTEKEMKERVEQNIEISETMKKTNEETKKTNEDTKETSEEIRKTRDQILTNTEEMKNEFAKSKEELAKLKKLVADVQGIRKELEKQKKLSEKSSEQIQTINQRIGDPDAPNPQGRRQQDNPDTTLETALEQSKDNRLRLDELDKNLAEIRNQLVQGLAVALTVIQKEKITEAIRVQQRSEETSPPRGREGEEMSGREGEEKKWYRLTFSVVVEPTEVGNIVVIDEIEKVIYHFDSKYWSDPSKVRINRQDKFAYATRVWGKTSINVEIFVKGFDKPLTASVQMNLVGRRGDKAEQTYAVMQ